MSTKKLRRGGTHGSYTSPLLRCGAGLAPELGTEESR